MAGPSKDMCLKRSSVSVSIGVGLTPDGFGFRWLVMVDGTPNFIVWWLVLDWAWVSTGRMDDTSSAVAGKGLMV